MENVNGNNNKTIDRCLYVQKQFSMYLADAYHEPQ